MNYDDARRLIRDAFLAEIKPTDLVRPDLYDGAAACVASHAAGKLVALGVAEGIDVSATALSTDERNHLLSIRGQLSYSETLWRAEIATLDRLLGAKP